MSENRVYMDTGINWNWYLSGTFNDADRTVEIRFHDRWHRWEDLNHPIVTNERVEYQMLEDRNREVYGVKVGEIEYLVLNPRKIFDYRA